MKDAIKATASFICHHIVPFIVFCLAGAGVLITLVLHRYEAEDYFRSFVDNRSDLESNYVVIIGDAGEQEIKAFLEDFDPYKVDLSFLAISGPVEVRLDVQEPSEYLSNTLVTNRNQGQRTISETHELFDDTRLTSFYPEFPTENMEIMEGAQDFSGQSPEIMYADDYKWTITTMYTALIGAKSFYQEPRSYTGGIIVNETQALTPISRVFFSKGYTDRGLYTAFEHFYYFTDQSDRLIFQFDIPLSKSKEKSFLALVHSHFHINEVIMPSYHEESVIEEHKVLINVSRTASFLCMLGIFVLFRYIIKMRREEFNVVRMVGATRVYIGGQMLVMLCFSVLGSFIPAAAFLLFFKQSSSMYRFLEYLSIQQVFRSVIDYIGIILLCACVYFFADIARFKKSVSEEKQ